MAFWVRKLLGPLRNRSLDTSLVTEIQMLVARMENLGAILLPTPGWDASPWQGYPQH